MTKQLVIKPNITTEGNMSKKGMNLIANRPEKHINQGD